jgi:Antitoxin MazE-like
VATTPKKKTKSGVLQRSTTSRREHLPPPQAQFRVPDLRDPEILADIPRQAKLMAQHPENDVIDAWIEQIVDWEAWK